MSNRIKYEVVEYTGGVEGRVIRACGTLPAAKRWVEMLSVMEKLTTIIRATKNGETWLITPDHLSPQSAPST